MSLKPFTTDYLEAGCDEAGRGCLAGPVVAAAVILPKGYKNKLINDSKKINESTRILLEKDIKAELLNVKTVKPMSKTIIAKLKQFNKIVTVEEHTIIGGLYGVVAEQVGTMSDPKEILPIALPDSFGPTGTHKYLLEHHGLTGEQIAYKIGQFVQ